MPLHVAGASCSRPSMERPAPCSEQTKYPSLLPILFLLFYPPTSRSFAVPASFLMCRRRKAASPYRGRRGVPQDARLSQRDAGARVPGMGMDLSYEKK
jgi:hypothetical protein